MYTAPGMSIFMTYDYISTWRLASQGPHLTACNNVYEHDLNNELGKTRIYL
jgi:hypothetical protein